MDQYYMNEHKLDYCVCGSDLDDKPCECGYYAEANKKEESKCQQ